MHACARAAPAILGRPVEGIWHTGIVCYGKEYFFGSGINSIPEADFAQSFGMSPTKTVDLGDTEIPAEVFEEWVADRGREFFSSTSYNLIRRNCNHFTGVCQQRTLGGQCRPRAARTRAL